MCLCEGFGAGDIKWSRALHGKWTVCVKWDDNANVCDFSNGVMSSERTNRSESDGACDEAEVKIQMMMMKTRKRLESKTGASF